MNNHCAFVSAFWAGLASPTALYAEIPPYRPAICNLTFADSFGQVGLILSTALREGHVQYGKGDPSDGAAPANEQLSFDFTDA